MQPLELGQPGLGLCQRRLARRDVNQTSHLDGKMPPETTGKQPPSATQKVMRVGSKDPGSVLSDFLEGSEVVVGKEIDGHDGLRARG